MGISQDIRNETTIEPEISLLGIYLKKKKHVKELSASHVHGNIYSS